MQEKINSLKALLFGTFKRAYFWGPPILLDPFDLYRQYIKNELPKNWQIEITMPSELGFALFIFMIGVAVFLTYHEERAEAITLREKLGPKLAFVYAHRPPYEDIKYRGDSDEKLSSTFRIGVKNIGGVFLSQCAVVLEPAANPIDGGWLLSKRLKLQSDNPLDTLNMEHKQSFSLAPGQQETVEILSVYEQKAEIKIWYAKEGQRDHNLHDILKIEGDMVNVIFNLRAVVEIGDSLIDTYCLKINRTDNTMQFGTLAEFAKANQLEESTQDTNS